MAKDILIVPGSSNIHFSGSAVNDIKLETQDSGSVAFTSNSGSILTLTNSFTGSLFSVGDVSGVPILDVNSDDTVTLGQFSSPLKVLTNASSHTIISGSSTSTGSFGRLQATTIAGNSPLNIEGTPNFVGDVGIGTATPTNYHSQAHNLVIYENNNSGMTIASANNASGTIFFADSTTGDEAYKGRIEYNHGTNKLHFGANSVIHTTLDPSGNFGIGTSSPNKQLHVHEPSAGSSHAAFTNTDTGTTTEFLVGISSGEIAELWNENNTSMRFATNDTERVRIDNSGKVGIGTATPGVATLSVWNTVPFLYVGDGTPNNDGSWDANIMLDSNQHSRIRVENRGDNKNLQIFSHTGYNPAIFATDSATGLRIGVGSTTVATFGTNPYLNVHGTTTLGGNTTVNGDMTVTGTLTAQEFKTELNTTTVIATSGSTKFGNTSDDVHQMTGSLKVSGSLTLQNGFSLSPGVSNYANLGGWINVGTIGLYSGTNGAHLYPNQGSTFGAWRMNGSRGGYGGIAFEVGSHYNVLMSNASNMGFYNDNDNEWMIQAVVNGQVNLFYNGVSKLSTSSTGATVSGNLRLDGGGNASDPLLTTLSDTNTGIYFPGSGKVGVGGSGGLEVELGGTFGGNVGIGSTSPYSALNVRGANTANGNAKRLVAFFDTTSAAAGTGAGIALGGFTNGTGGDINDLGVIQGIKENGTAGNYASALIFQTRANGAGTQEQMRISSTGNVGIGDTTPTEGKLVVAGDGAYNAPPLHITMTSSTTFNHFVNMVDSNLTAAENGIIVFGQELADKNSAYIGYKHRSDHGNDNQLTLGFWGANNLVNILPNGRMGIGTETPLDILHVVGNHRVESGGIKIVTNGQLLEFGDSNVHIDRATNSMNLHAYAGHIFSINGSTAMTIDNSGYLGIGATPSNLLQVGSHVHVTSAGLVGIGLAAPETDLHISNASPAVRFTDENVSNLKHQIIGGGDAGLEYSADFNNVAAGYHRWDISGAEKMRLIESGDLGIGTSAPLNWLHMAQSTGGSHFNEGIRIVRGEFAGNATQYAIINNYSGTMNFISRGGSNHGYFNFYSTADGSNLKTMLHMDAREDQYITPTGSAISYNVKGAGVASLSNSNTQMTVSGSHIIYQDLQEKTVVHNGNDDYQLMKTFTPSKGGRVTLQFEAYISSGTYYWAFRIGRNGDGRNDSNTGAYQSYDTHFQALHNKPFSGYLDPSNASSVHAYRKYNLNIRNLRAGETVDLYMVSSTSGGTPQTGNGQTLYLKNFKVLNDAPSAEIDPIHSLGKWVGVGTTSPSSELTVKSTHNDHHQIFEVLDYSGDGLFNIRQSANSALLRAYADGAVQKVQIHTAGDSYFTGGNVGIGDTSPGHKLSVSHATSTTTQASFEGIEIGNTNTTVNAGSAIKFSYGADGGSHSQIGAIYADRTNSSEDTHLFFGTLGGGSYSEKMRITSTGNVGIGTATPDSKLEVRLDETTTQSNVKANINYSAITIQGDYTNGAYLGALSWATADNSASAPKANIYVSTTSNGSYMHLGTSNAYGSGVTNEAIVIDYSGETTFTSTNATVEIATTTNGTYGVRSSSPAKFNDYYFNGTSGHIRKNDATSYMSFDSSGNATIPQNLDVGAGLDVTGNITVTGTVDGVDISALNTSVSGKVSTTGAETIAGVKTFSSNINAGTGQIITPGGTNLALNPNTGIVSVGGVIQTTGTGNNTMAGNLVVDGNITAKSFITQLTSILHQSGSTKFGDSKDDLHQFTGSVRISDEAPAANYSGTQMLVGSGSQHHVAFIMNGAQYGTTPAGRKTILKLVNNATGYGAQYNNGIEFSPYHNKAYAGIYGYWHTNTSSYNLEFRTTSDGQNSNLVTAMTIDEGQRVGIGNTNPTHKLDVSGTGRVTSTLTVNGAILAYGGSGTLNGHGANLGGIYDLYVGSQNSNQGSRIILNSGHSTGEFVIQARQGGGYSDGNIGFYRRSAVTTFSTLMHIGGDGKVGIGTETPQAPFNVFKAPQGSGTNLYHQATFTDSSNAYNASPKAGIAFAGQYNSTPSYIEFAGIMGVKENTTHGNFLGQLKFLTNTASNVQTVAMTINSSQNVGIGTTNPGRKFVVSTGSDTYAQIETTSATNDAWLRFHNVGDNNEALNYRIGRTHDGRLDFGLGNGTHLMSLISTGLGIHTHEPSFPLSVGSNTNEARAEIGTSGVTTWQSNVYSLLTIGVSGSHALTQDSGGTSGQWFNVYDTANKYRTMAGYGANWMYAPSTGLLSYRTTDTTSSAGSQITDLTPKFSIDKVGKVGVGTDAPVEAITIRGTSNGTDGFAYPAIAGYTTTTKLWALEQHFGNEGRLALYNAGNLKVLFRASGSSYINNGATMNFGIGTASPSHKLDVSGTGRFTGQLSLSGGLHMNASTITLSSGETLTASGGYTIADGNAGVILRENGSNRIVLNSNTLRPEGNNSTLLGSTAQRWSTINSVLGNFSGLVTAQSLTLQGWSSGNGLTINYGNATGTVEAVTFRSNGGVSGNIKNVLVSAGVGDLIFNSSTNTTQLTLYRDGNVGIGTTAPEGRVDVQMNMSGVDWTYGNWSEVWDSAGTPGNKFNKAVFHIDTNRNGGATGGIVGLAFSPGWQGHQNWGIYSTNESGGGNSQGDLRFVNQLNGGTITERVTFKADGKVGIGDSTPSYNLDISGNMRATGRIYANSGVEVTAGEAIFGTSSSGTVDFYGGNSYKGGHIRMYGGDTSGLGGNAGKIEFRTLEDTGNIGTAMAVMTDSNFGIGCTQPLGRLVVNGGETSAWFTRSGASGGDHNIMLNTDEVLNNRNQILFNAQTNGVNGGYGENSGTTYASISTTITQAHSSTLKGKMEFKTSSGDSNQVRMTIADTGNIGIGTTGPTSKLHVNGNVDITGSLSISRTSTYNNKWTFTTTHTAASNYGGLFIKPTLSTAGIFVRNSSDTDIFTIHGDNVGIGTTGPTHDFTVERSTTDKFTMEEGFIHTRTGVPTISLVRTGGTVQSRANLAAIGAGSGEVIGNLSFGAVSQGGGGTNEHTAAGIKCILDANFTTNDAKGAITVYTKPEYAGGEVERMRISSAGLVGIGTDNPDTKLHVSVGSAGTVDSYYSHFTLESSGNTAMQFLTPTNSDSRIWFGDAANNTSGGILYTHNATPTSEHMELRVNSATRLKILGSGYVGIGTTSPIRMLDIRDASGDPGIRLESAAHNMDVITLRNADGRVGFGGDTITVSAASDVGIGILPNSNFKTYIYDNTNAAAAWAMNVYQDGATGNGVRIDIDSTDASDFILQCGANGGSTEVLNVMANGRVGVMDTTPSYPLDVTGVIRATGDVIAYSDERIKDNIETIENPLEKVKELRGVSYNRNDIEDKSKKIGVIAQEVEKVLPEVVEQDDEGKYSVAYGNMVGLLIESVKEQQKQIEELKSEIQELKDGSSK